MKALLPMIAGLSLALAAGAQASPMPGPFANPPPARPGGMHGFHHFRGGFFLVPETEVVHDVLVVHDQPAEAVEPPPPPPPPKEKWVLGKSYAELPGGCMKMVERSASYFYCDGEWYRQLGSGGAARYRAVAKPI